ncbi:MAG: aldehyde dehydrogenase [Planctomycetes bacterium]|nr:aldehyde dehydrogenase [Planctomycetota bacterium]
MTTPVHIPVLRAGEEYTSLDLVDVVSHRDGAVLAKVSQANAGIVKRDLRRIGDRAAALRAIPMARMLEICKEAGQLFLEGTLSINGEGATQSPEDYVRALSATSGLPHTLCRKNMQKVFTVFDEMESVLRGLTRGMDPSVVDTLFGDHDGIPVCYAPAGTSLGVVLPSNSPGVNSIWMPAIALKVPVVLKPGREEPWTPLRIVAAFVAAGCPKEAFSLYPTDHEGAATILERCGRGLIFGDAATTKVYASNPAIQLHGPGWSKVVIGEDAIDSWEDHLDVLVASVADNGGRSCINASAIFVPRHGDAIAAGIARRIAGIAPRSDDDPDARLSAFANPKFAEYIDAAIESGLAQGGAEDVTARFREGPRARVHDGGHYLMPTIVRCDRADHPLANTEYLFPYASVVEVPPAKLVETMGKSLVVSAITRDPALIDALVRSPDVDRLNLGPLPTSRVEWNQPHEGNLFEFLYTRRAIQEAPEWQEGA